MKTKTYTKFAPILALALLSISSTTHAQANKPKRKQMQFHSEIIEISALEFAKLMSAPTEKSDHTALRNKLTKQIKAGKAKLVSKHSIISGSGDRSRIESKTKLRYPIKYESPAFTKARNNQGQPKFSAPKPTDFETRDLGTIIEIDTVIAHDNKTIDLTLKPEIVKHVGDTVYAEWVTKGAKTKVSTPNLYTCRLNTSLTLIKDEFTLAAAYTPEINGKPDNTKKLLHFVKGEVLEAGK